MSWHELHDPGNRENPNAGNGGDLVKHTVYLSVIDYLAGRSEWSAGLRVRECHAGRGMYAISGGDGRRPLLECLYAPIGDDVGVVLHDAQRATQRALKVWPDNRADFAWYAGSGVLNALRLNAAEGSGRELELYESAPHTRTILRAVIRKLDAQLSRVSVRVLPDPDDHLVFDGERYIEGSVSGWNRQDLVLLDPFAMWRQPEHQSQRDRYGRIIDSVIEKGEDAPSVILFWTWGRAFEAADGDLNGASAVVSNGYQDLRSRLQQAGTGLVRVTWRWGLQFGMWIIAPKAHLEALASAASRHCDQLLNHLVAHGCGARLRHPNVEVQLDRGSESIEAS